MDSLPINLTFLPMPLLTGLLRLYLYQMSGTSWPYPHHQNSLFNKLLLTAKVCDFTLFFSWNLKPSSTNSSAGVAIMDTSQPVLLKLHFSLDLIRHLTFHPFGYCGHRHERHQFPQHPCDYTRYDVNSPKMATLGPGTTLDSGFTASYRYIFFYF